MERQEDERPSVEEQVRPAARTPSGVRRATLTGAVVGVLVGGGVGSALWWRPYRAREAEVARQSRRAEAARARIDAACDRALGETAVTLYWFQRDSVDLALGYALRDSGNAPLCGGDGQPLADAVRALNQDETRRLVEELRALWRTSPWRQTWDQPPGDRP